MPFAQREMTDVFMQGIDEENMTFLRNTLGGIFNGLPRLVAKHLEVDEDKKRDKLDELSKGLAETLKKFFEDLEQFKFEEFTAPVLEAIEHLDKGDLASMAESLVAVTALKRRVTLGAETVGGPIDVAVISKGDGFIWIKRKHYFDIELNWSFMQRYLPLEKGTSHEQSTRARPNKKQPRR